MLNPNVSSEKGDLTSNLRLFFESFIKEIESLTNSGFVATCSESTVKN